MKLRGIVITTLFVVLIGVSGGLLYIIRHEQAPIDDSTQGFGTTATPVAYSNSQTIPVFIPSQTPTSSSIFDWVQSRNIKHTTYTPPVTVPEPTYPAYIPQQEQDTIETHTAKNDPFSLWDWLVSAPAQPAVLTPTTQNTDQRAYKSYGNAIGSRIQVFVIQSGDQNKALSEFVSKRDSTSASVLITLASEYERLGEDIMMIESPEAFLQVHRLLGERYVAIGTELRALAESQTDTEVLKNIYAYNAKVDNFAQTYVQLASLFGALEVIFTTGEGGDIFSPPSR